MFETHLAALQLLLGLLVVGGTVVAVFRRVDVRLALGLSGVLLGLIAGHPLSVMRAFMAAFVEPKVVVPICFAMGFAYVLKQTECDRHLVQLLIAPLRRVRLLLIPGTVMVGFLVNIPVVSQTGTAASVGAVLIPILFAMRIAPAVAGAALLLGSSIGGELMNPGGTQYGAITQGIFNVSERNVSQVECVAATRPLNLTQLVVATAVLYGMTMWSERRAGLAAGGLSVSTPIEVPDVIADEALEPFRVNYVKACVPVLPLLLLFAVSPPAPIWPLPVDWLVESSESPGLFSSRLVGAAMLIGFATAVATCAAFGGGLRVIPPATRAFFDGIGYGFREIISIIAVAACFADGVMLVGIGTLIQQAVAVAPSLLLPAAGYSTFAFAFICGSGIAASKGLFEVFAESAVRHGLDPLDLGAVMAVCADAGRTMSPVAAVTLMCARLTGTEPADLIKRVALPLIAGISVAIAIAFASR
jgi:DcuC family C4-dicarboxylate transporter